MKHAELHNNVVVTLRSAPYPEVNPQTIEVPDHVELGWISTSDGGWEPGPIALREQSRADLQAEWQAEPETFLAPFLLVQREVAALLNQNRDLAAELAVRAVVAPAFYTAEERLAFEELRDRYADKIHDLPKLPE